MEKEKTSKISEIKDILKKGFEGMEYSVNECFYRVKEEKIFTVETMIKNFYKPQREDIYRELSIKYPYYGDMSNKQILNIWDKEKYEKHRRRNDIKKFAIDYFNHDCSYVPNNYYEFGVKDFIDGLPSNYEILFKGLVMYHKGYNFAGVCDLIIYDKEKDGLRIFNYKLDIDFSITPYDIGNLLSPFDNYENIPRHTFFLEMSLYKIILEQYKFPVLSMGIVKLSPDRPIFNPLYNDYIAKPSEVILCEDNSEKLLEYLKLTPIKKI